MSIIKRVFHRYRYSILLLRQLVKTDFKLRYQGSVLGYIWSLLRPLLLFVTLYFVFTKFLKVGNDIPHKPVYLLLGIVLWNFFGEITSGSVAVIVNKGDLIRKINFPKYNIILAVSFSAMINLGLNFIVVAIFMFFNHIGPSWDFVWIIPLLIELYFCSLALAFILSSLFVKFRDVTYIWEVFMQAGFYATPILYPLSGIPHSIARLFILSPISQVIQDARRIIVTPKTTTIYQIYGGDKWIWLIPVGLTLILVICGGLYFKSQSKYFAEEV